MKLSPNMSFIAVKMVKPVPDLVGAATVTWPR